MVSRDSQTPGLVPFHIGVPDPGNPLLNPLHSRADKLARLQSEYTAVAWQDHGVVPRWLGQDTTKCVAAINPYIQHGEGLDEFERFRAGARSRGEVALFVAALGNAAASNAARLLGGFDASFSFGPSHMGASIGGQLLPSDIDLQLAPNLSRADKDLALRLRQRDPDAPWWALAPKQLFLHDRAAGATPLPPGGALQPILVDALGNPVVAAWVPDDQNERWYIVPYGVDWDTITSWLVEQALPAYVPNALPRARSPLAAADPKLETSDETRTRQALEVLERSYAAEKARLEAAAQAARAAAAPVRDRLLYGTGPVLERCVGDVLEQAGFQVTRLDEELGTESADLFVEYEEQARLVEVKSAGGAASEKLVAALQKHLDTWPQLKPGHSVAGGVLVVNHQHKLEPSRREPDVYQRRAFVESLLVEVLSSRALFDWWRASDWEAIRTAVLGQAHAKEPEANVAISPSPPARARGRGWKRLFS